MPSVNNPPPKTKHIAPDDMQTPTRPSKQYGQAPTGRSGASNSSVLTSGGEGTPTTSNTFRHLIHSKRRPIEETPTRKPSNAPKSRPVSKPAGASSETTSRNASTPIKDQLKRMNADELGELLRDIHKTQQQHDEDSGTPSPVKVNKPGSSNAAERRRIDSDEENPPESSGKPAHRAKIIKAGRDAISVIHQAGMGDDSDLCKISRNRDKRYRGLQDWKMIEILEFLPVFMHLALALFLAGLVIYLWNINITVASLVFTMSVLSSIFYAATTLVPLLVTFCPYKTPQLDYTTRMLKLKSVKRIIQALRRLRILRISLSIPLQRLFSSRKKVHNQGPRQDADLEPGYHTSDMHHSHNPDSFDVAVGALGFGKFKIEEQEELRSRINLHLAKGFLRFFNFKDQNTPDLLTTHSGSQGGTIRSPWDYLDWLSHFAGANNKGISVELENFLKAFGPDTMAKFALACVRLTKETNIQASKPSNVSMWLSSLVHMHQAGKATFEGNVLVAVIDSLTMTGYSDRVSALGSPEESRRQAFVDNFAIVPLVGILNKIKRDEQMPLRYSIRRNLLVFALTADLHDGIAIDPKACKGIAEGLISREKDENLDHISWIAYSLLALLHPLNKIELDPNVVSIMDKLLFRTRFVNVRETIIPIPGLTSIDTWHLITKMLVECSLSSNSLTRYPRSLSKSASMLYVPCDSTPPKPKEYQCYFEALNDLLRSYFTKEVSEQKTKSERGPIVVYDAAPVLFDSFLRVAATLQDVKFSFVLRDADEADSKLYFSSLRQRTSTEAQSQDSSDDSYWFKTPTSTSAILHDLNTTLYMALSCSNSPSVIEQAIVFSLKHLGSLDAESSMKEILAFLKIFKSRDTNWTNRPNMTGSANILAHMLARCTNGKELASTANEKDLDELDQILKTLENDTDPYVRAIGKTSRWTISSILDKCSYSSDKATEAWDLVLQQDLQSNLTVTAVQLLLGSLVQLAPEPKMNVEELSPHFKDLITVLSLFGPTSQSQLKPSMAVVVAFWGLALDARWAKDGWSVKERNGWRDRYMNARHREVDETSLFLCGLSIILSKHAELRLDHTAIETISKELNYLFQQSCSNLELLVAPQDIKEKVEEIGGKYIEEKMKQKLSPEELEHLEKVEGLLL
ncbi:hypothetical protein RhiJN_08896 [Ceratobasidium sp. AG-Ba]|nr:hypothetical protein RhiJN_08896 [Ceratobasidium sp. AG-Ba]